MSRVRPRIVAQEQFEQHEQQLRKLSLEARFRYIYENNLWGSQESRSGVGSTLAETAVLRRKIVELLLALRANTLLDVPCGDFHWLSEVDLPVAYTGADIVEAIVESNQQRYASPQRTFLHLDLTRTNPSDPLPGADVVLCRDCLVHLSYANIHKALANVRASGSRYLLMTHFPEVENNRDIADGDWRPLNFQLAPFHLPPPLQRIVENCAEAGGAYSDKSLGLWALEQVTGE